MHKAHAATAKLPLATRRVRASDLSLVDDDPPMLITCQRRLGLLSPCSPVTAEFWTDCSRRSWISVKP